MEGKSFPGRKKWATPVVSAMSYKAFWRKAFNIGGNKGKGSAMKPYRISGTFLMGDAWSPFKKEVAAKDQVDAVKRLYSDLGSKHRVKRRNIKITSVEELEEDQVQDPIVGFLIKGGAEK